MNNDRKAQALSSWRKLREEPGMRMNVEERYDELLKMADTIEQDELITPEEWRQLVRKAAVKYAQATEGLEGGT